MDCPVNSSVKQRVSGYRLARRASLTAGRTNDERWTVVDSSRQTLEFSSMTTSATGFALLRRTDFSTPSALLAFFHFILSSLCCKRQRKPILGHSVTTQGAIAQKFVGWRWRWLRQDLDSRERQRSGKTTKKGMRNARNYLSERSPEKLNGLRKTYHIHRTFYFSSAGAFEKQLCSNFKSLLSSLGEFLFGDGKLFRSAGKGPNKTAKVGIWHYQ